MVIGEYLGHRAEFDELAALFPQGRRAWFFRLREAGERIEVYYQALHRHALDPSFPTPSVPESEPLSESAFADVVDFDLGSLLFTAYTMQLAPQLARLREVQQEISLRKEALLARLDAPELDAP